MRTTLTIFLILILKSGIAQFQHIRGTVVDKDAQFAMPGVVVTLINGNDTLSRSTTDMDGEFRLENVAPGRYTLSFRMTGFEPVVINAEHISGKELLLRIEMEERIASMKEVTVTAHSGNRGDAANEMATVSARRFSVEETNRYAGSRGDPARMASNYAGVNGNDDSRNDIIVRGNSPLGVLWMIDGLTIPNPNHFAIAGSQGGPVTVLNNKLLANSDFYTGAFPAEFGNSLSSVFDLRFRNGNNEQYEFTGQFGILGTEITAEGPFSKNNKGTFLFSYRYSTLKMFEFMGLRIGTDAVPTYQDLNFKLNFPLGSKTNLSVFGIGGLSGIDIKLSDEEAPSGELQLYGDNDRDQYFDTGMGMLGASLKHQVSEKTYLQFALGAGIERQHAVHDYFERYVDSITGNYVVDSLGPLMRYEFLQSRISSSGSLNSKLSGRHLIKVGYGIDAININNRDSIRNDLGDWTRRWDYQGWNVLVRLYAQWKYRMTEDITINAGLHSQYMTMSNSISPIEPRAGLRWELSPKHTLSAGIGLHSQMQPLYTYVYQLIDSTGSPLPPHNATMDFTKSWHYVLGYDWTIGPQMRIKAEAYYQSIYDAPVQNRPSSFSMLNMGSGFSRIFPDTLVNDGTGRNYGLELTIEKFFSKQFFFLATGSIYDSKYKGSDGVLRNTDFNSNFAANFLLGSEFKAGKKGQLTLGTAVTWAGGRRYGVVDTTATTAVNELIYLDQGYNEFQFQDYFRLDLKIQYRINAGRITHELAVDLVNILDNENILELSYTGNPNDPIQQNYQLGFLPLFYYRIDF